MWRALFSSLFFEFFFGAPGTVYIVSSSFIASRGSINTNMVKV